MNYYHSNIGTSFGIGSNGNQYPLQATSVVYSAPPQINVTNVNIANNQSNLNIARNTHNDINFNSITNVRSSNTINGINNINNINNISNMNTMNTINNISNINRMNHMGSISNINNVNSTNNINNMNTMNNINKVTNLIGQQHSSAMSSHVTPARTSLTTGNVVTIPATPVSTPLIHANSKKFDKNDTYTSSTNLTKNVSQSSIPTRCSDISGITTTSNNSNNNSNRNNNIIIPSTLTASNLAKLDEMTRNETHIGRNNQDRSRSQTRNRNSNTNNNNGNIRNNGNNRHSIENMSDDDDDTGSNNNDRNRNNENRDNRGDDVMSANNSVPNTVTSEISNAMSGISAIDQGLVSPISPMSLKSDGMSQHPKRTRFVKRTGIIFFFFCLGFVK